MGLVTVTDHDSIAAAGTLRRHADFFLSEEVTCATPDGGEIHIGVYGMEERHHEPMQLRRGDLPRLLAYLGEQRLFHSVNHMFSSLTGPRTVADFALFAERFPAFETRNGQMLAAANRSAAALAERCGKAQVAGSDAHTLASLGKTYTEVAGARDANEFVSGLRHGRATVHGENGDLAKLTLAVWTIGVELARERPWAALLLPLMAAVPAVTVGNYIREAAFQRKWSRVTEKSAPVQTWTAPAEAAELA